MNEETTPMVLSAQVEIEKSRAVQEVQAALVIAKKFPRDSTQAYNKIIEACKRKSLAEKAVYKYPRGGETVSGPSIRLAEVMAQAWGNIDFGVRELERRKGPDGISISVAESYCWDMETNVRQKKEFEVPHVVMLKNRATKRLEDPRDIYEHVANNGARRLRACILGIIPGDIVEAALSECRKTVAKGDGEPLVDRIRKCVVAFSEISVNQTMLDDYLKHPVDQMSAEELADLFSVYQSIRDGVSRREDFFSLGTVDLQAKPETKGTTVKDLLGKEDKIPEFKPEEKAPEKPVEKYSADEVAKLTDSVLDAVVSLRWDNKKFWDFVKTGYGKKPGDLSGDELKKLLRDLDAEKSR